MNIAFLGSGLMGYPMIERLLRNGDQVWVWNRTASRAKGLAQAGATVVTSVQDALAATEVVILMLTDGPAVDEVLFSRGQQWPLEGKTIIQMGTIGPDESVSLQKKVFTQGGEYLECPVLGSRNEARDGKLILMAGTTPEKFEQWGPLLSVFGEDIVYAGQVGQAAVLKLALNQLIAAHAVSFSFSLALVQSYGVKVDLFREILKKSTLGAPMFERKLPNWLKRDFHQPNFPTKHLLKDVRLIQKTATDQHLAGEHVNALESLFARAVSRGWADQDYSSVYNEIAPVKYD